MNTKAILALAGAAVLSFSCISKNDFVQKPVEGIGENRGLLTLGSGTTELELRHNGEVYDDIAFYADEPWEVDGYNRTWLVLGDAEGKAFGHAGESKLSVSARPNLGSGSRTQNIVIKGKTSGEVLATLSLTQENIVFNLDVPENFRKEDGTFDGAFEWYQFESKDGEEKRADVQPSARTLSVKSNLPLNISRGEKSLQDSLFVLLNEARTGGGADLNIVPLGPGMRDADVTEKVFLTPDLGLPEGMSLTPEERKKIASDYTYELDLSQTHFLFTVEWADGSDPLFNELASSTTGTSAVFKVTSDTQWTVDTSANDWIQVDKASGDVVRDENVTVSLAERKGSNPTLESRDFNLVVRPVFSEEVDRAILPETKSQLVKTLSGRQKALVFKVTQDGDTNKDDKSVFGYDFSNNDKSKYSVTFESSVPYGAGLGFNTRNTNEFDEEWLKITCDGNKIVFGISENGQNLKFDKEDLTAGYKHKRSYQSQGYAYFSPASVSTSDAGEEYFALVLDKNLFDPDLTPEEIPSVKFEFSQAKFVFDIEIEASQKINGITLDCGNLPPALSVSKMNDENSKYGKLLAINLRETSGRWKLGPDSSKGLFVSSDAKGKEEITAGDPVSVPKNIYFAPKEANQEAEKDYKQTLQIVSVEHLNKYGEIAKVPEKAILNWDITQRRFTFNIHPSSDKSSKTFASIPAYSNDFSSRRIELEVECDGNWKINEEEIPEFLEFDKNGPHKELSGDGDIGNYTLQFIPKANVDIGSKDGEIIVYCTDRGNQEDKVSVRQEGFVFDVPQSENTFEEFTAYYADAVELKYKLTEGAIVRFDKTNEWVSPQSSDLSGTGDEASVNLNIETNTSLEASRSLELTMSVEEPEGCTITKTLRFNQRKYILDLKSVTEDLNFAEVRAGEKKVKLISSGPWDLKSDKTWLHVNPSSGDGSESETEVTLTVDNNNTVSDRSAKVSLTTNPLENERRVIDYSQSKYKWNVTVPDGYNGKSFGPLETDEFGVTIESSGDWTVTKPEWVTIDPDQKNFSGKQQLTLSVNRNLTADERKQEIIKIESNDYNSKVNNFVEEIKLSQSAFQWNISSDSFAEDGESIKWASAVDKSSKVVTVQSSGEWKLLRDGKEISELDGWTLKKESDKVTLTPPVNDSREVKASDFSIVSVEHEQVGLNWGKTIILSQPAFALNVSEGYESHKFEPWNKQNENAPQATEIDIVCSDGEWELVPDSDWVHVENKGASAKLTIDNYNSTEQGRDAVLTLSSKEPDITLNQEVNIHQEPFVFEIVNRQEATRAFTAAGGSRDIAINCSAPTWEIFDRVNLDFAEATKENNVLHVDVKQSNSETVNVGRVVLISHDVLLEVPIEQGNYKFDISGLPRQQVISPKASDTKIEFDLVANVAWSLYLPSWLKLTEGAMQANPAGIETNYHFVVTPSGDNETSTTRTERIVLENDSTAPYEYEVSQEGFWMEAVNIETAFRAYAPEKEIVQFNASIPWRIERGGNSWINVEPAAGDGGEDFVLLTITPDTNTGEARSGSFTIVPVDSPFNVSRTVSLNQDGFVWEVSESSHNFEALAPKDWYFEVESSAPASVSVDQSWVTEVEPQAIPAGEKTRVTVRAEKNNLTTPRIPAVITISDEFGHNFRISLTQDDFKFSAKYDDETLTPNSVLYFSPAGGNRVIDIESTGDWHLHHVPGWLEVDVRDGDGGKARVVLVSSENTKERRSDTITLVCEQNDTYNVTFTVIQDVFNVDPVQFEELPAVNPDTHDETRSFNVTATKDWTLSASASWIHVAPGSGSGNGEVTVTVDNNPATDERTGSITVTYVPEGYDAREAQTKTVSVSQAAYKFNVTEPSVKEFEAYNPGTRSLGIECSDGWIVSINQNGNWLSVLGADGAPLSEGSGNATLVLSPQNNTDKAERKATVTISSKIGGHRDSFTVTQSAYQFEISPDGPYNVGPAGTTLRPRLTASGAWKLETNSPEWISAELENMPAGQQLDLAIPVGVNNTQSSRTGTITFVCIDNAANNIELTVNQGVFNIGSQSLETFSASGDETQTIQVYASSDWTADAAESWITVDKAPSGVLSISVSDNPNTEMRTGTLSITCPSYDSTINLEVKQAARVIDAYVDLGLSVKWASCNLGASRPEEYGDYYAWGETEPKDSYTWETYKYSEGSTSNVTKYNEDDGKTVLEPDDDAAHVKLGGSWRMPTYEEWIDLRKNCTFTMTELNGINGCRATSNINGASIFFPSTGYIRDSKDEITGIGGGMYWLSTLHTSDLVAWSYILAEGSYNINIVQRRCGQCIRPVTE